MDNSITKQTLFEHFAGRLTALQRSRLEQWLQEPANRELYYEWIEEWERQNLQYEASDEMALQRSLQHIDQWEQHRTEPVRHPLTVQRFSFFSSWLSVAATVVLCLLTGMYTTRSYWLFKTIATVYGEVRTVTLPDGSVVTLNAHSSVKFPRFGFGYQTREVQLIGEAAFSVKHTLTNQRFVVRTPKGIDIVVLGTEFNVFARPRGTNVVLKQGKILLTYHSPAQLSQQLLMRPGDQVSINQTGKLAMRHGTKAEVATAWKDHRFIFSQTSMTEIIALIEENYDLTVRLKDNQLAGRTVSGTFQAKNADEFLQVIAELLEINYKRQENTITFFE